MAVSTDRTSTPAPGERAGIPGSELAGPFGVGEYAQALREKLRSFTKVQLIGELVNLRRARTRVYFELRDAHGAIPCAAWLDDWEAIAVRAGAGAGREGAVREGDIPASAIREGVQVIVAGGCDYYPGSASASPSFSFTVTDLRVAGEGELLARIERLRKQLHAEGLLERQKQLRLTQLPRTIGVVTGESGKARDDVRAALTRRGWAGRLVWGFAPVQDRHAAPAITRAVQDLAAVAGAEAIVVARGGGSLADLWCFCDETLCRTVALLGVPVIASVGHHTDRTLLDDVACVSCSTPTHAAEAAVSVDCVRARAALALDAGRLSERARRALLGRAQSLAALSRAPTDQLRRQRTRLHQQLREMRAAAGRRVRGEQALSARRALVLQRKATATARACRERGPRELERLALALAGHDPQRTLERGYALVQSPAGEPIATAAHARRARALRVRFADDAISVRIQPDGDDG
jgi:exodeoxyribonuclease VII large subunit